MGHLKTTGTSHNKNYLTYISKHVPPVSTTKQHSVLGILSVPRHSDSSSIPRLSRLEEDNDSPIPESLNNESMDISSSKTESEVSSDSNSENNCDLQSDPDEENTTVTQNKDKSMEDEHSYLQAHHIQSKRELLFPFAYFSVSQDVWLCKICGEYGDGNDYWRKKADNLQEYPKHKLNTDYEKEKKTFSS